MKYNFIILNIENTKYKIQNKNINICLEYGRYSLPNPWQGGPQSYCRNRYSFILHLSFHLTFIHSFIHSSCHSFFHSSYLHLFIFMFISPFIHSSIYPSFILSITVIPRCACATCSHAKHFISILPITQYISVAKLQSRLFQ